MIHEIVTFLSSQIQNNKIFSGMFMGGGLLGLFHYSRGIPHKIYDVVLSRASVVMQFDSKDPMYEYIQLWLMRHTKYDRFKKRYRVFSRSNRVTPKYHGYDGEDNESNKSLDFIFAPYHGVYNFRYKGKWMHLNCDRPNPTATATTGSLAPYETLTLHYLGHNLKYAHIFLSHVKEVYAADNIAAVHTYLPGVGGGYWAKHNKLLPRDVNGIICSGDTIKNLVNDIDVFKNKGTEEWYNKMGIPYHRGYLFTGPPGTGKSSTAYALATHFNMNIYFLTITANVTDNDFLELISNVGDNSFLVLEDVDTVFDSQRNKKNENKISFSSVLNALDGFCSKHGNMVIMTTNFPDKIDSALLRPGRMDYRIHFGLCTKEQIEKLFLKFFPEKNSLAKVFSASLKEGVYSPAQLQEYFLARRNDIDKVMTEVYTLPELLETHLHERQKSKIVKKISEAKRSQPKDGERPTSGNG